MPPTLPRTGLRPVEVFSTEDTVAQLTWRTLPAGDLSVRVGEHTITLGPADRPGAADIGGLPPATTPELTVCVDRRPVATLEVTTEPSLDGPPLSRIATISDLHMGEQGFGLVKPIRDRSGHDTGYPLRCARAAVREATDWGAELLVIKGDITDAGRPEEWAMFDELLDHIEIPVLAVPGNHDTVGRRRSLDAATELRSRGLFPDDVHHVDIDGARVVLADSTVPKRSFGRIGHRLDELDRAVDTDRPALVFLHHHLEPSAVPRIWPLGVPRHHAHHTLDHLLTVNPDLLVSSGHTHRNRARRHAGALITEVSSTKDHPGVWAGYVVHATGVRQVLRRVASHDCIAWTDRTHAAVGGIWGRWSPGGIADRSVTHRWTGRRIVPDPVAAVRTR